MGKSSKARYKVCGIEKDGELGPFFKINEPVIKCVFKYIVT